MLAGYLWQRQLLLHRLSLIYLIWVFGESEAVDILKFTSTFVQADSPRRLLPLVDALLS